MKIVRSNLIKVTVLLMIVSFFGCKSIEDFMLQTDSIPITEVHWSVSVNIFDKIWGYILDLLGPIIALFTVLITIPLVRKKLIENHITKRIEQIHQSNSQARFYCQKLLNKYTPLVYTTKPLKHQDIKNLYKDIEEGFLITQDSSSEVATLMYYLKSTIQQIDVDFQKNEKYFHFYTSDLLRFVVGTLYKIVEYSTQVVPVPVTAEIKNVEVIIKPLRNFVTDGRISKFKNFKLGVNYDVDSANCLIYTDMVNRTELSYLMESAFLIANPTKAIAKLLYIRKIYAPLFWESKSKREPEMFARKLTLIGFAEHSNFNLDAGISTQSVVLFYSNLTNIEHRPILTESSFLNEFKDSWLDSDTSKIPEPLKFYHKTSEIICVEIERDKLHERFKLYKKDIKSKLIIKREKLNVLRYLSF
jgi:hypothetical protein